jgi:RNA polymerase sigma-70 factor (ECF subfamily)
MTDSQVKKLIQRVRNKDREAFAEIYNEYFDAILKYVYRRTLNEQDTQDIVSNVFMLVLHKINRFKCQGHEEKAFLAWFYRITGREIVSFYRKNSKYNVKEEIESIVNLVNHERNEEDSMNITMNNVVIKKALENLKPIYQEIIYLRFYEDLSYSDVARTLRKNENTVRVYAKRGLRELSKYLPPDFL